MAWRLVLLRDAIDAIEDAASALHSVFGASMIRRRREVASVIARMLVVREPRPQACGHIRGLEVLGISAAWRVLGLGVEPLLRQSFDDPQRIARPLVEVDDVVFVVARAVAHGCAMLESWVAWRRRRVAADPSGCGTRRHMPGAPHETARCTDAAQPFLGSSRGY